MIARVGMMVLVLMTALLLATVVAPAASFGVWRPDLVALTVVAFALADGAGTGGRYGFAAGLAVDLLSGGTQLVGTAALVLLLVGYATGALRPYVAASGLPGRVAVAGAASAVASLGYGVLAGLLESSGVGGLALLQSAAATGLYNAALAPAVLLPVGALCRRIPAVARTGS